MELNTYIDSTNLKANSTKEDIKVLCNEAVINNFKAVCINPCYVRYAASILENSNVSICTVIGFPLGANKINTKIYEMGEAIKDGINELDVVINIGALKDKDYDYIEKEVALLREASLGHILKIIIETSLLTHDEIIKMCEICKKYKVDYIKTSTGYSTGGATVEVIILIKKYSDGILKIKASGGIKTYEDALLLIEAGADRIGTSSGLKIMDEANNK